MESKATPSFREFVLLLSISRLDILPQELGSISKRWLTVFDATSYSLSGVRSSRREWLLSAVVYVF